MYPDDLVESLFDAETCTYLQRKNRGGSSGAKGSAYENYFAVFQLACYARYVIEAEDEFIFSCQISAFVDDLVISCADATLLRHYQLKNSVQVTWGQGLRSIADDFAKQQQLNKAVGKSSNLALVVSDADLQARLAASMPRALSLYSQVLLFPYAKTLLQVVAQVQEFREAIAYLSAFEDPSEDKIECVANVLLAAWQSSGQVSATLSAILAKAQQFQPSYIRPLRVMVPELDAEVVTILGQIEDFAYTLTKGFLHWQFKGGIEQGTLRYSCETEDFQKFQALVKKCSPSSFEELEGFLL